MIIKKISSLAASIISLFIFIFFFSINSNAETNDSKLYSKDNGVLSIMYHRFNENKYPSTNIKMDIFKKQIQMIKDLGYEFYNPNLFEKEFNVKKNKKKKIHNATKIFQALRIFVNQEISELINGLINSFNITPLGGIIVVVTFHSIEDKIVKFFFKNFSEEIKSSRYLPKIDSSNQLFKLVKKKPTLPKDSEINNNPRSRSAKLRYGIKISNKGDFSELLKKFDYLLKTENLSNKL